MCYGDIGIDTGNGVCKFAVFITTVNKVEATVNYCLSYCTSHFLGTQLLTDPLPRCVHNDRDSPTPRPESK